MATYENLLKEAGQEAVSAIRGQGQAMQRESAASQALALRGQGITGPIAEALKAKSAARIAGALAPSLAQASSQAKTSLANAQLQRDIAFQQMIGNIVGGIGQTAGTLATKFIKPI